MIAEIGQFVLILALVLAVIQATLPLWGAARGDTVKHQVVEQIEPVRALDALP